MLLILTTVQFTLKSFLTAYLYFQVTKADKAIMTLVRLRGALILA